MDIIVVELPNGRLRSSSFHVRFSSTQVINSKDVEIFIYINGKKKDVKMKLAKSGDAYFSLDKDKLDKYIIQQSNLKIEDNNNNDYYYIDTNFIKLNKNKHCSLIPTEEQIKALDLKQGKNEICFAIETYLGGIQILKSNLYFWPHNIKIILWDIDGTVTKSDILGVILPRIGIDWYHEGVIDLINKMSSNGYKILYLTARAIFQSDATHEFLANLKDKEKTLPYGPIIMDPDGVFSSFKKGIVQKQQHLIKILSLMEIKNLFGNEYNEHFFAGFGNKETDAIAYRYLQIPMKNIFIINPSSNISQLGDKEKTTYLKLIESCDKIFPKY
jgi:phosphatidate phosphatase LPIN